MLIEYRRYIILRCGLAADPVAFGAGVGKATTHTRTQDTFFEFTENRGHLQECCAHRVHFPIAAIDHDRADDHQLKVLLLDCLHDLAELEDGP